jgi:hypothetical protein
MIYEVYINDNLLYYPNEDEYAVFNAKLETALNEAGSFECDIPKNNIRYSDFDNGQQLRSGIITVLKEGVEIFCGEVREVSQNFDFTKHIYAVGELAYLFDSIQPQAKYQGTVEAMFTSMLSYHNSQVENRKKFTKGQVLVTDSNNYVYHFTNREDTLSAIRDKLCDTLNGYLRIRKVGTTKYLDLIPLANYGRYCQQEIQFGENMLDYSENYTANDIATCVIPLGVRFDENKRTAAAVDGLDEYLTIKGTSVDAYHTNKNNDYVYIQSAVNRFGWVRVVKHWDDVTVAENLKTKAEQWLQEAQYAHMALELSAVDLSLINSDIESFEIGDTVHCWAEPYGMDTTFPVQKKTVYLNDLSKNFIILSNERAAKSYTSQQSKAVSELKEEIPQISPVLEQSRAQALAMLLSETQGGHVVYEYHYNNDGVADYIEAINVCNFETIAKSTKRWRWSQNGFGYMYRSSSGTETVPAWQGPLVALTSDGKINADRILSGEIDAGVINVKNLNASNITAGSMSASRITSGTMSADRIYGGTINGNNVAVTNINASNINAGSMSCNRLSGGIINGQSIQGCTITGGTITSEGTGGAKVTIEQGGISSNSLISCSGITAGNVIANNVSAPTYSTSEGGSSYNGISGQVTWVDATMTGHSLVIKNGLIVGMA